MLPTPLSDLELQANEKAYVEHVSRILVDLYDGLQNANGEVARNAAIRKARSNLAKAREIRGLTNEFFASL
jgi:hypothetical protein